MIKNIIFDIGIVILNFNLLNVLPAFTDNKDEQKFILDIKRQFLSKQNSLT